MELNKREIWRSILNEIEVNISKANFVTWFNNTYIYEVGDKKITIAVPSGFSKEWLENKFDAKLKKYLKDFYKNISEIEYKIVPPERPKDVIGKKQKKPQKSYDSEIVSRLKNSNLNPKYSFETLVVGEHNELAKAAAEAVVEEIGVKYNPLYIFGGVGLGKTHLIQAIGNCAVQKKPKTKVKYVSSEKFTNDFVLAIKNQKINVFKDFYHNLDVLLIDDIQFIGGKEGTQEQFFHIFNNLYQENKQIVLCSDCPPRSIPALEERLCSRFEGGMIADVSRPNLETRIAILIKKAGDLNFPNIPSDVLEYIASYASYNVRELEGFLNKFVAHCQLKKLNPNLENAQNILKDDFSRLSREKSGPSGIIDIVSNYYKVESSLIKEKSRRADIIKPRQIVVYILREKMKLSFPVIGKELGGRDHTTIIHNYNKVKKEFKKNPILKQEFKEIEKILP
ncbi:MAG: chromosomal replication initiator protein DnaA [Candidatus Moranbacteria bacterium]|nr:chromosomal replication initiator protein DnaA [Candidatus Moranbacteria bacterium]